MPLEALRYDLTPTGLHYLLVHFDIPWVDPVAWRLRVGGKVRNELALSLDELRQRPRRTLAVTFECAGNGRARLSPRPISQPWLNEAARTADWTRAPPARPGRRLAGAACRRRSTDPRQAAPPGWQRLPRGQRRQRD